MPAPTPTTTLLRAVIMLALAIIVLAGLTTVTIVRLVDSAATQDQFQRVQHAQELSLVESCERLNILRIQDNTSHYADYEVFSFVARSTTPMKGETPAQKRLTAVFLGKLRRAVLAKTWTPVTDCSKAVNERGAKYRAPQPIPFAKRLPPRSALTANAP